MTNIGWVGTGVLGSAIVKQLLRENLNVNVYNRTIEKTSPLKNSGATVFKTAKELTTKSDIIFLCLTGHQALNDVLFEKDGILEAERKDLVIVDVSTVAPDFTKEIAAVLNQREIDYLDCPVSGGPEGALEGKLTAVVSGSESSYIKIKNYLALFCKTHHYVGESGTAQTLKVLNNLAESINLLAASEVISLGLKTGLDLPTMYKVLKTTRGNSVYMNLLFERLLNPVDEVSASLEVRVKDLKLANELANRYGHTIPQGYLALEQFIQAEALTGMHSDQSNCIKLYLKEEVT